MGARQMEQDKLWATFQKTGKVADYLRYCGIDIYETGTSSTAETDHQEASHEADHRRTDRAGKQQYR